MYVSQIEAIYLFFLHILWKWLEESVMCIIQLNGTECSTNRAPWLHFKLTSCDVTCKSSYLFTKWLPPWRKGRISCLWIKSVFDCLTIDIIHETMVVHMTWVWTFFNNYIYICYIYIYIRITDQRETSVYCIRTQCDKIVHHPDTETRSWRSDSCIYIGTLIQWWCISYLLYHQIQLCIIQFALSFYIQHCQAPIFKIIAVGRQGLVYPA